MRIRRWRPVDCGCASTTPRPRSARTRTGPRT
jgi:hypothetical protein